MSNLSSSPSKSSYIPALDGIRAIAILLVLFSHSVIYDQFNSFRNVGLHLGYTGVSIFFVLSGYLITRLLLQEEENNGKVLLSYFYARRALRLLPALWIYLLVIFLLWTVGLLPDNPWHSFLSSLFYIRNLVGSGHETAHLWSLSLEQQFYFLWPVIIVIFPKQNVLRFLIAVGVILIVFFWRYYAMSHGLEDNGTIYIRTDFRIDSPLIGSALALWEKIRPLSMAKVRASTQISDGLFIVGVIFLSVWITLSLRFSLLSWVDSTIVPLVAGAMIIGQVSTNGSLSNKFLTIPVLVFIGKISYGVYLWQALFLAELSSPLGALRKFPLNLVLTFTVAWFSYCLVEKPILRLKNKKFHK